MAFWSLAASCVFLSCLGSLSSKAPRRVLVATWSGRTTQWSGGRPTWVDSSPLCPSAVWHFPATSTSCPCTASCGTRPDRTSAPFSTPPWQSLMHSMCWLACLVSWRWEVTERILLLMNRRMTGWLEDGWCMIEWINERLSFIHCPRPIFLTTPSRSPPRFLFSGPLVADRSRPRGTWGSLRGRPGPVPTHSVQLCLFFFLLVQEVRWPRHHEELSTQRHAHQRGPVRALAYAPAQLPSAGLPLPRHHQQGWWLAHVHKPGENWIRIILRKAWDLYRKWRNDIAWNEMPNKQTQNGATNPLIDGFVSWQSTIDAFNSNFLTLANDWHVTMQLHKVICNSHQLPLRILSNYCLQRPLLSFLTTSKLFGQVRVARLALHSDNHLVLSFFQLIWTPGIQASFQTQSQSRVLELTSNMMGTGPSRLMWFIETLLLVGTSHVVAYFIPQVRLSLFWY